jgi:hypothetical protein
MSTRLSLELLSNSTTRKNICQLIYCLDREATDDDIDDCELTCTEILAAFPETMTAETSWCVTDEKIANAEVVYSRAGLGGVA